MDRLFRCLAGSSNVSVLELNALPFPDLAKLERQRAKGLDFEQSVRVAQVWSPNTEHSARSQVPKRTYQDWLKESEAANAERQKRSALL